MSRFGKAISWGEFPLLIEQVDLNYYKSITREIHHLFTKTSKELEVVIINLAHNKQRAIPSVPFELSRPELKKVLKTLLDHHFIELILNHYHNPSGRGRVKVFQRTELFEKTFSKFRLPARIRVTNSALSISNDKSNDKQALSSRLSPSLYLANLRSKSAFSGYFGLDIGKQLSMSNGGQVFKDIDLYRVDGKRLYAHGTYQYQGLSEEERKFLLIDGEPTAELDFVALHGNLLLNSVGAPSSSRFYENILVTLGLKESKRRRKAIKRFVCASFNIKSKQAFSLCVNNMVDKNGRRLIKCLNAKPIDIYKAIIKTYPMLEPFICTGDNSDYLQTLDGNIMVDILETLAKENILALPLHDSVITPSCHKDRTLEAMKEAYKKHTGFCDGGIK